MKWHWDITHSELALTNLPKQAYSIYANRKGRSNLTQFKGRNLISEIFTNPI